MTAVVDLEEVRAYRNDIRSRCVQVGGAFTGIIRAQFVPMLASTAFRHLFSRRCAVPAVLVTVTVCRAFGGFKMSPKYQLATQMHFSSSKCTKTRVRPGLRPRSPLV